MGVMRGTLVLLAVVLTGTLARAPARQVQNDPHSEIHILQVQGRVYMLVGAGANITVQVGDEAVVLVDAGVPQMSDQVLSAIRTLSQKPIEYIIDTSADEDHIGGNQNLAKAGHFNSGLAGEQTEASIVAHLGALNGMSEPAGRGPAVPQGLWPTDTYDNDRWALFNDEAVIIEHLHAAHTDGDSIVFFRRSDVVSAGDIFVPEHYPVFDPQKGGSIDGEINALNKVIELMVPKANEEGGTYVIPGHGRLCDRAEIADYRDMVTIIRDRIEEMVRNGETLQQVKAAKPTLDYDGEYGAETGPWMTSAFIEAVYGDLSRAKNQQGQKATGPGEDRR
jgi:glyoxylase-like metal-dependent hydrolase (beta-lactamase superfamily II)